jgi:hypothetical protein
MPLVPHRQGPRATSVRDACMFDTVIYIIYIHIFFTNGAGATYIRTDAHIILYIRH